MTTMRDLIKARKQPGEGVQGEAPTAAGSTPPQGGTGGGKKKKKSKPRAPKIEFPRLPDGSVYNKTYDAATQSWTVTLTIPVKGDGPLKFSTAGSGSMRAEFACDLLYRTWFAEASAISAL